MDSQKIVEAFYTAFAAGDAEAMVLHYHKDVRFQDPAFGQLQGDAARDMWRMLIARGGEHLKVAFSDIHTTGDQVTARWTAHYPFGKKRRPVVNHVAAAFTFRDGKIHTHTDSFDLWKWSQQALGTSGLLLGWTPFMQGKIRQRSRALLESHTSVEGPNAGEARS